MAFALALVTAVVAHRATASARELRSAYGDTVAVLVVTEDVAMGAELHGLTTQREVPEALLPSDPVTELGPDDRTRSPISKGSILTRTDLRSHSGISSGQAALALPRSPNTPPVTAGTSVLMVINADPFSGVEPSVIKAEVLDVTESQVLVTMAQSDMVAASAAMQNGVVTLALAG